MSCSREKWLDVFVTKPDQVESRQYTFDDEFLCTIQSVQLSTEEPRYAAIVDEATNYLLPTWSGPYSVGSDFGSHPLRNVEAGDIVRIGNSHTAHTDYLTVVEVIHVTRIYNCLGKDYTTGSANGIDLAPYDFWASASGEKKGNLLQQTPVSGNAAEGNPTTNQFSPSKTSGDTEITNGSDPPTGTYYSPGTAGIAHIVLRVNVQLNATVLPTVFHDGTGAMAPYTSIIEAMKNRGLLKLPMTNPSGNTAALQDEAYAYPLYLNQKWSHNSTLHATLDHGIKGLACIKLVGYTVVNKRQIGITHQHETINDDFLILHIDELNGKVISNNKHANGAFAVLHTPVGVRAEGAIEHSQFDASGIVTHQFDNCESKIRKLTIKVTDRRGQPAHIGRLHLWFKLLVLHG